MTSSVRTIIMGLLKTNLGESHLWDGNEAELAMLCAELPEPISEGKRLDLIVSLKKMREVLLDRQFTPGEIAFLDEEIDRYQNTTQMSLYVEEEDLVEKAIIQKYAQLSLGTEGVVGIHLPFNYQQLRKLTNGVYKSTGLIKFYISREKTLYGKIVAEIYEHPQKIPIATLIESMKLDKETGEPLDKRIAMFGEKVDTRSYAVLKEIEVPLYVYRFISEKNEELILLTVEPCNIGDYIVTGVTTQCNDVKMLTDSARLPTKLPFFFAQMVKNRIIRFKEHSEFKVRLTQLGIHKETFFNFPFTVVKGRTTYLLKQPHWFKWFIWAWLTHQPKGLFNNYPMHILMIGIKHSGKSLLLNGLHARSKEARKVFSGSSSTLKHLVPSFKYKPARLGYLAESNRFSFCDEFLRCLINTRTTKEGAAREESVAIMNDLLEHQKREAGSGVSKVNVNMTARILATTNPIRDIHNVEDLLRTLDESFLSRWMIYYQPEDHVNLIRRSKDTDLRTKSFKLRSNDWISLLDYLHSFPAEYDMDKVEEIYLLVPKVLSENLKKHYDARHMHHLECLMDGIVKTRCMLEGDMSFTATQEDYDVLKEVWLNIIRSWIDPAHLREIDVGERIFYLPENSQYLYWKLVKKKHPVSGEELKEIALKEMTEKDFNETIAILRDMGVLLETEGYFRPHYMDEDYDGTQERLD